VTYRKGRLTTCWRIVAIPTRRFQGVGQTTTVPHPRANNAKTHNTSRGDVENVGQYQKTNATLVIARNTGKGIARLDPRLGAAANEWPRGWSIRITSHWQNWRTRPPHQPSRSLGQNQYGGLPRHRHCHGPQTLPSNLYRQPLFCLWERAPSRRNTVILPPVRRPQEGLCHPWQTNDQYPNLSNVPTIPVETTRPTVERIRRVVDVRKPAVVAPPGGQRRQTARKTCEISSGDYTRTNPGGDPNGETCDARVAEPQNPMDFRLALQ
jgi:hypothetical protein